MKVSAACDSFSSAWLQLRHHHFNSCCSQQSSAQAAIGADLRRQCDGIIQRAHTLAKELTTLPPAELSAKWAPCLAQGGVGAVMAELSGTASAEAFVSLFLSVVRATDLLLKRDDVVVDVRPPVKIFGDIHGQLQDLLRLFLNHGFPITGSGGDIDVVTYVFNGDFVDRGTHQLEVILLLFSLKIVNPSRVVLLRGNHETDSVSSYYGYKKECYRISGSSIFGLSKPPVFQASLDLFEWLPVAAVVSGAVLILHGGIGDCSPTKRNLKPLLFMAVQVMACGLLRSYAARAGPYPMPFLTTTT